MKDKHEFRQYKWALVITVIQRVGSILMLRIEFIRCTKCGKEFMKTKGGIIKGINDDCNICSSCKLKIAKNILKK